MPRILLDVTRLAYRRVTGTLPTGIDRVGVEYARRYGARARAVLSLGPFSAVLSERDSAALLRALLDPTGDVRVRSLACAAKALLWRWLAPPGERALLVNTAHTGLENRHYGWSLRRRGARALVMVHDLIPITHPQYFRPGQPARHRTRMRCAATVASGIVANSAHTLAQLNAYCASQGLAMPRAVVAHLGAGLPTAPAGPRPIQAPYFLVLGTIEPRKNHAMLLEVWKRLARPADTAPPRLVVIGQRGWQCAEVERTLREMATGGLIIARPHCSDAELATWLRHARALLFPSFTEGYGLPVTEALCAGVPVIASDLAVFRETAGEIPDYADPRDALRWEALVRDYARPDSALRAAQLRRLEAFAPPTWATHFAAVDALVAQIAA